MNIEYVVDAPDWCDVESRKEFHFSETYGWIMIQH